MPLVGLEPGPFDPESSALTTGPLTPHIELEYGIQCMQLFYEEIKRDGAKYN